MKDQKFGESMTKNLANERPKIWRINDQKFGE